MRHPIHRLAHFAHAAGDTRRCFVMHNANGFDLVIVIVSESGFDDLGIDTMSPVSWNQIDVEAELRSNLAPQDGKLARLKHQDSITGRKRIDQRCLPGSRTR